jgi:hypothetical protein
VHGEFKPTALSLGLQVGLHQDHLFLCEWDRRAKSEHWERHGWPPSKSSIPGSKNIIQEPLADRTKVLLPPSPIQLGNMAQIVRGLDKDSDCFKHMSEVLHYDPRQAKKRV